MYILPDDIEDIQETIELATTALAFKNMDVLLQLRIELYQQQQNFINDYTIIEDDDGDYDMVLPLQYAKHADDVAYIMFIMEETLEQISLMLRKHFKRIK